MLPGLTPGLIKSYDPDKRTCRVSIPGMTDGADVLPEAEFCNPLGDKSEHTEIELLQNDRVWLAFENGDERFPIIMGFRPKRVGNVVGWRRYHHANIELNADGELLLKAGVKVHVVAPDIVLECERFAVSASESITFTTPQTTVTQKLNVNGLLTWTQGMAGSGGSGAAIQGNVSVTGGDVNVDGIGSKSHHHTEHDGPSTSAAKA